MYKTPLSHIFESLTLMMQPSTMRKLVYTAAVARDHKVEVIFVWTH